MASPKQRINMILQLSGNPKHQSTLASQLPTETVKLFFSRLRVLFMLSVEQRGCR